MIAGDFAMKVASVEIDILNYRGSGDVGTVAEAEDRTGCLNKYQEITTLMFTDSNISVILFIDKQTRLMLFQVINDVY